MYLVIDNTTSDKLVFFISTDGKVWNDHTFTSDKNGALLLSLEKVLSAEKIALKDLKGIAVRVGKGKFTSTRIAVTVGNTLAYALQIPIIAEMEIDFSSVIQKIKSTPVGQYALPVYSGEPRLGNKD